MVNWQWLLMSAYTSSPTSIFLVCGISRVKTSKYSLLSEEQGQSELCPCSLVSCPQGAIFVAGSLQPLWPLGPTAATRNQERVPLVRPLIVIFDFVETPA
jgi:hypothetical protein